LQVEQSATGFLTVTSAEAPKAKIKTEPKPETIAKIVKLSPEGKKTPAKDKPTKKKTPTAFAKVPDAYKNVFSQDQYNTLGKATKTLLNQPEALKLIGHEHGIKLPEKEARVALKAFEAAFLDLTRSYANKANVKTAIYDVFGPAQDIARDADLLGLESQQKMRSRAGHIFAHHLQDDPDFAGRAAFYLLMGDPDYKNHDADLAYLNKIAPDKVEGARDYIKECNEIGFFKGGTDFIKKIAERSNLKHRMKTASTMPVPGQG
jgi:hypothetical protein